MSIPLADRLVCWAQNEEMINERYTAHGMDCLEAAKRLEWYEKECIRYERELHATRELATRVVEGKIQEIERLKAEGGRDG